MRLRELERRLEIGLDPVRAWLGSEVVAVRSISPVHRPRVRRGAYRLDLADGRTVKLRHLPTAGQAQTVARALEEVADGRFPRVLFRFDRMLVEEWVEGRPLCEASERAGSVEEAGHLLGSIHAKTSFDGAPLHLRRPTAPERERVERFVAELVLARALSAAAGARLLALAAERDPGEAVVGLCHGDFCAENMLVDGEGRLRIVDNEGLAVGPLDLDLATTAYRWPLADADRERFLAARASRGAPAGDPGAEGFWRIRAVVKSAHVRAVRAASGAEAALRELERILAEA